MRQLPVVLVEWEDITTDGAWKPVADIKRSEPVRCATIGYLLSLDRVAGKVILAHTLNSDDDADHTRIPLGVVRRIRRMRLSGKEIRISVSSEVKK